MPVIDLSAPALVRWTSKAISRERPFFALKDAVRFAMKELRKAEFLSACIATADDVFEGDQIVELFQRNGIAARRVAWF